MFFFKKAKKEANGRTSCSVSFLGDDKIVATDRDILILRINSQIVNFMSFYDHIDFYIAGVGEFDKLVLKILNFYRGTDGKLAKSDCYIVNSELKSVKYEDIDPFDCPPTDEELDRIRKFLVKDKMLISYAEGKSSAIYKYYEDAIANNGLALNLYLAE